MKVKKIGLVGMGRMGSRHLIAINQLKKAKLVAGCDLKKNNFFDWVRNLLVFLLSTKFIELFDSVSRP